MERLDAIVAGIGVLVVAVAIGGVVATGPGGQPTFDVVFQEVRSPLAPQQASFTGDASVEVPFNLAAQPNLTRLEVTVRVAGAGLRAAGDALTITLVGPDGREETQEAQLPPGGAADASVTFQRTFRSLPAAQQVRAADEAAAVAAAQVPAAAQNGTGTWTVTVAASTQGPPPLHVENHTVAVEPVAFTFRGVVPTAVVDPR